MIVCYLIYIDPNVYWNAVWNRWVTARLSDISLEREKKKILFPKKKKNGREKKKQLLVFCWETSEKKKKKKKMGNNEFIKLKMHRPMERLEFNRRQMEREPPLLLRYSDTAPLIAWSCLVDSKSSQAVTWWEQVPEFAVRRNCLFNIRNQYCLPPLLCMPVPKPIHLCRGRACQATQGMFLVGYDKGCDAQTWPIAAIRHVLVMRDRIVVVLVEPAGGFSCVFTWGRGRWECLLAVA